MTNKIKKVCSTCDDDSILMDAWTVWNVHDQKWELEDISTTSWCCTCDGECHIKDVEIA